MPIKRDRVCTECRVDLTEENWLFISDKYKNKSYICDPCRKAEAAVYRKEKAPEIKQMNDDYRFGLRETIMNHYGSECAICHIDNIYYLTIDHINGGGNIDRKINKLGSGHNFYRYLIKNNYPEGFRTLCFNCNCSVSACVGYENKNPIHKRYREERKKLIIDAYGGRCTYCAHAIIQHLTIDHINGLGEGDMTRRSGTKLYNYLIDNNFPKDNYQLLCYNCNCAKAHFDYYPKSDIWKEYHNNIGVMNVK